MPRVGQTQETFVTIVTCTGILLKRLVNDKMEIASTSGDAARTTAVSLGDIILSEDDEEELKI